MRSKIIKIIVLFIIFIGIICCGNSHAAVETNFKTIDYTDEYKEYMSLTDEEKQNRLEPSMYDVISPKTSSEYFRSMNNILNSPELLRSALNPEYDLRDIISNNVAIRDQMQTNSCWAFATIGSLESNIALLDYKAGTTGNIYDFSERHMDYAARKSAFNNGETNDYGYNVGFDKGGTFYMAQSYLTNGMGAIDEEEMPFENNEDNINISEIQGKNTTTTLYDTIMFEDKDDIGVTELMSKMKQVISNYGGIYAGVHGAQLLSEVYNNETGAIYCPESKNGTYPIDHAVVIIGWDDTYSKDNFNESNKPQNDGAWIVKNSWGDKLTEDLSTIKEQIYAEFTEECNQRGWDSADKIENDFVLAAYEGTYGEGKARIEEDKLVVDVGDSGYMYVSYEDAHIYNELYGIEKATATKDYDNIYQNNKLNASVAVGVTDSDEIYIANKFTRDSSKDEVITMVSVYTLQEVTCKVYINPNSSDLSNVQEVELEAGNSITIEPGYHTIMLKEPVKLTGDSFAIAMSLQTGTDEQIFMIETKAVDENVEVNSNESFYTTKEGFQLDQWVDLNTYESENIHGNVSIKAFTEEEKEEPVLTKIEITTPPAKITYTEGEDFEEAGMVIQATYSDLTTKEITNYSIKNGDNLYYGQDSVTISYTEDGITKEVVQNITVNQIEVDKEIKSIEVLTLPTKTTYMENEELNLEGGIVRITYTDDSTEDLNMNSQSFTITGFDNKIIGKQNITVEYEGFTTTFEIEIVEGAKPILSNLEEMQTSVTDANIYLYYDIDAENYVDMSFEIDNIKDMDANTDYTYYYYLSESDSEENIEDWVELKNISITENEDGTYTMKFKISSKDMVNYEELNEKNPDELYIYLKEVAKVNDESIEQIKSNLIDDKNVQVAVYKDNEYAGSIDEIIDNNNPIVPPDNNGSSDTPIDDTISPNPIPQTGIISIGIVVVIIAIFGVYFYIKHKNIDK